MCCKLRLRGMHILKHLTRPTPLFRQSFGLMYSSNTDPYEKYLEHLQKEAEIEVDLHMPRLISCSVQAP